ncbi:hypothetical protein ACIGEP_01680 [Microbacterium sp. NPDC077663]|uniref:hypothetical protein n=1 Tax=Microbacterium sp. NPDC077663 TaxID=3364189 RepID=UPI0037C8BAA3
MNTTLTAPDAPAAPARRKPTRALVAVSAGATAIALGVGGFLATTAAFTDQKTVTGNTVSTAELTIGDTASVPVPVNATNLIPGGFLPVEDVLVFTNAGTVDFQYTISLSNITGDTALQGWTDIAITADGKTATGTLADPPHLKVSSLTPTDPAVEVDVTVGLSTDADNTVKDKTATFDLVVNATQNP